MLSGAPTNYEVFKRRMENMSKEDRRKMARFSYFSSAPITPHDPRNLTQRSIMYVSYEPNHMLYANDTRARSIKQPVKSQAKVDQQRNNERFREFIRLVEKCCEQKICFCKHKLPENHGKRCRVMERVIREATEQPTPYSSWSVEDLLIEVKHRNIALPRKRTKGGLTKLLQQSDPPRSFRLMDLPVEVRLHIYGMAFDGGRTGDLDVGSRRDVAEPALLQTSRQIRAEATPVFYGTAYFRFMLPVVEEDQKSTQWIKNRGQIWLQHTSPNNMKDLRHVSFRFQESFDEYDLHIDLASRFIEDWLIPFGSEPLECPCRRQSKWTLMQWREKMSDTARPEHQEEVRANFEKCISTANKAIQDFQALCGQGGKVEPTIPGLAILAEAVHFVLESCVMWMLACIDGNTFFLGEQDID
ncbi:unnamed protein product [Aureobasidium vineae]|uniref:Uncharacterized protein n=1 Tax=Aureobasidium vineae TaxID=2773715 RepID=A0A9N8P7T1_9PEZI|nr:unnamed protein product [Aureobasidium vineae]